MELSQKKKVLLILIRDGGWLPTYAFEDHLGIFVGHRGPARISELSLAYPELIETDRTEKTYRYRMRFDNMHVALQAYPNLSKFLREKLAQERRSFSSYKNEIEYVMRDGVRFARPVKSVVMNSLA